MADYYLDSVFYEELLKNLEMMENTISDIIKLPDVPNIDDLRKNLLIVEQYTKAIEYFRAMIGHYIFSDHSEIPSSLCNELLHVSLGEILLTLPEERFSIYYQLLELFEELRRLGAEEEFVTSMKKHMGGSSICHGHGGEVREGE